MNNKTRFKKKLLSQVVAASLLAGAGTASQAGDFALANNSVAWLDTNGNTLQTVTVGANGVASSATLATNPGFVVPDIGFQLNVVDAAPGDYFVRIGLHVESQTNENHVLNMTMGVARVIVADVGGTNVIQSVNMVTSGQANYDNIEIRARRGNLSLATEDFEAKANMLSFDGATKNIRLNVGTIFNALSNNNALFDEIMNGAFGSGAHYDYGVLIQPVAGPTTVRVGHENGGTFSLFPRVMASCPQISDLQSANVFNLSSSALANKIPSAHAAIGTLTVGSPGTAATAQTAIVENCHLPAVSITSATSFTNDTGTEPYTVAVTATATDADDYHGIASTEWLVGGNVVATGTSANLSLNNGDTTVTFRATDEKGGVSTTSATITVSEPAPAPNQAPEGLAIGAPSSPILDTDGKAGETLGGFSATATDPDGDDLTYEWFVNGNSAGSGASPSLTLPVDGANTVFFIASDGKGGEATSDAVTVEVRENQAPVVTLTVNGGSSTTVDYDQDVTFTWNAVDPEGRMSGPGTFLTFATDGDFGIGPGPIVVDSTSGSSTVSFSPVTVSESGGTVTANIQFTDDFNKAGTATAVVIVRARDSSGEEPPANNNPTIEIVGPTSYEDTDALAGEAVTLTANVTDADGDDIVLRQWTALGETSSGAVLSRRFPDGDTPVTFRAVDSRGGESETVVTVNVATFVPAPSNTEVLDTITQQNNDNENLQQQTGNLDELIQTGGTVSQEVATTTTTAATKAEETTRDLQKAVTSGTVTTSTALKAIQSTSTTTTLASNVSKASTEENKATITTTVSNTVKNAASTFTALATRTTQGGTKLSDEDSNTVKTASTNLLKSAGDVSQNTTSKAQIAELARSANEIIQATKNLGVGADETVVNAVRDASASIATAAAREAIRETLSEGEELPSDEEIRQVLEQNEDLLEDVFNQTLEIPPTVVDDRPAVDPNNVQVGGTSVLDRLRALFRGTGGQSTLMVSDGRTGTVTAVTAEESEIVVDAETGAVTIILPGETYAGAIVAVRSVPAVVPNGIRIRRDGRGIIVTDGIAVELAPVALNLGGFTTAVEDAGFGFTLRNNATISLDLGGGERFSGAFAYDNLTDQDVSNCGAISFTDPTGPANSAGYAYGVNCANGVTQKVQPFVDNADFFQSMEALGIAARANRDNGFITLPGIGRFKASFFVTPLSEAEQVFHAINKDEFGIAYQTMDLNGDGIVDYKVISANGAQILYGAAD
ncbi:PKD domain-containing protein [Pseudohongiella spirulinae]|uniref:Uncharacterized protein n=1 Tax=Pseudohongiella spirulinae TaxID=1249552 RepID=A0A0S2KEG2_9GAMM|nr:PKD domain-containing protein [Pseudohongiella spirulinae]ALO46436.1 hypothetical protein PS2015_1786 [Pseudohongiella spirulinae]